MTTKVSKEMKRTCIECGRDARYPYPVKGKDKDGPKRFCTTACAAKFAYTMTMDYVYCEKHSEWYDLAVQDECDECMGEEQVVCVKG